MPDQSECLDRRPQPVTAGGIDCDLHPAVPGLAALLPYLAPHWRESVLQRGVHELDPVGYPNNSPLTGRPDWRPAEGKPGAALDRLRTEALDAFGTHLAICNPLYGVQLLFSEDMAAAFATAVNDWMAREFLDREPRLRASIVVAAQSPELAEAEIERCAADRRFVQVLLPLSGEMPLGRRALWPIYAAAERHRLPVGIHAGSAYRHPVTPVGWPSYAIEDYAAQAAGFQSQLTSLIAEGVFERFPDLTIVLLESGVAWLPAQLWRLAKFWRGLRMEIPWVDRLPAEIVRERVRLTIQPCDAPPEVVPALIEQLGAPHMLLFATDYPHWQFDGTAALPDGLPADLARMVLVDNPLATYPRLTYPRLREAPA